MQSAFRRALLSLLPLAAVACCAASAVSGQPHPSIATSTTLSVEPAAAAGKTLVTARISPLPENAAADHGTVTLEETAPDGSTRSLGSAVVEADGSARLTLAPLPGDHSIRALYSGTDGVASSASEPAELTAQAATAAPGFTLAAAPSTVNLDAGANSAIAITITPASGFTNYVALSCAGLPLYATCNFLPSNVNVTGTGGASTMTLYTTAPSGKTSQLREGGSGIVYALLLPGALGLVGLAWGRSRGLRTLSVVFIAASLIGGASSCAQRYRYLNYGPGANQGTPNGTSIIRVYGTAVNGALSTIQCFQVTLNVNNPANTSGTAGNSLIPCS